MEKKYYTISEVAAKYNLQQSTLRFWETEFPRLRPQHTSGGTRRYRQQDVELIQLIIYLTRDCHLTLEGARQRMSTNYDADMRRVKAIERLRKIRAEIVAIRRELNGHEALANDTIID